MEAKDSMIRESVSCCMRGEWVLIKEVLENMIDKHNDNAVCVPAINESQRRSLFMDICGWIRRCKNKRTALNVCGGMESFVIIFSEVGLITSDDVEYVHRLNVAVDNVLELVYDERDGSLRLLKVNYEYTQTETEKYEMFL